MTGRLVVTGVAGLIGSHLARALLERGQEVVGVDDLSLGREANLEDLRGHPSFRFHRADVRDEGRMGEAARGATTVVHLAALKIPRYDGYLKMLEVNVRGTEVVLECARREKARMVFASTDDVYGKNPDPSFGEESALVLGDSKVNRWAAAASKIYGEHLCFGFAESHAIPVSIIRYAGVYGPTYQLSKLSGPQDIFIYAALTEEPMPIHGDGTQTRPFAHVADAAEATLRVLDAPYAEGEVVNVGAAGTFVVRKAVSQAKLRAELNRRLPFKAELMICPGGDLQNLVWTDPFAGQPSPKGAKRFVTILAKRPRTLPRLPILRPDGGAWQVKVVGVTGKFAVSLWRRLGRSIVYPNEVVEKALGVPATTRNWSTIEAIRDILEE